MRGWISFEPAERLENFGNTFRRYAHARIRYIDSSRFLGARPQRQFSGDSAPIRELQCVIDNVHEDLFYFLRVTFDRLYGGRQTQHDLDIGTWAFGFELLNDISNDRVD